MGTVTVRYIVDDVDRAIDLYCRHLGFEERMHPAPTFAMLVRGDLRLLLSAQRRGRRWRILAGRQAARPGRLEQVLAGGG